MASSKVRVSFDAYKETLPANVTFNPELTYEAFGVYFWYWTFDYNTDITVSMIANEGFYFVRKPIVTVQDASGYDIDLTKDSLNADNTIYTFAFHNGGTSYYNYAINISIRQIDIAGKTPTPTGLGGLLTYYKVNDAILNQLSKVIFVEQTSSSGDVTLVDFSQFITSLRLYPFEIKSSDSISVILGNRNTKVKAPIANEILHEIDLGSVTIASTNNNTNDFDNTTLRINLPFIGLQSLQSVRYVGNTASLRYEVDLITGLCTANLYVDSKMLDCFSGKIGLDMPYKVAAKDVISGVIDTSINRLYPLVATMILEYHENYNPDNTIIIDDNKQGYLQDFIMDGYDFIKIDDVTNFPMSDIPIEISEMILEQLRQGIYLSN